MKIRAVLLCVTLASTSCKETEPPKAVPERAPPPPPTAQEQPRKKYDGTRLGPVLAVLAISDRILISGPKTRAGVDPSPQGGTISLPPTPIPVQDKAWITVTLSNDTDRDIDVDGDWPYLFRVSVSDAAGAEVFEKSRSTDALPRLDAGDVKEFEVIWPVRGLSLERYTVTLQLGAGGSLTAHTELW